MPQQGTWKFLPFRGSPHSWRGKFKEDILTYFPQASLAIDTGVDYKFKTSLPKKEVAERLQHYIMSELNVRQALRKAKGKKIS